jgi:hypothetical protein
MAKVRPFLKGPIHTASFRDVPEYAVFGTHGMPSGPAVRIKEDVYPPKRWIRRYFDRQLVIVRDMDAGDLYVVVCGPGKALPYCAANPAAFLGDCYHNGQNVFIHRPGWYDIYNDFGEALPVHEVDQSAIKAENPNYRDVNGYDPTTSWHRVIGCTASDPASLWTVVGPAGAAAVGWYPSVTGPMAAGILGANTARKFASVYNDSLVPCYIRPDGTAAAVTDMLLNPGAYYYIEATGGVINQNAISAITGGAAGTVVCEEWT